MCLYHFTISKLLIMLVCLREAVSQITSQDLGFSVAISSTNCVGRPKIAMVLTNTNVLSSIVALFVKNELEGTKAPREFQAVRGI